MDATPTPSDPPAPGRGHHLKLRYKQVVTEPSGIAAADVFGRDRALKIECTIELDGKPLRLVQDMQLCIDAATQVPHVTLTIVPTDLDIEVDAEVANVVGVVQHAFSLTKPGATFLTKTITDPEFAAKLAESYKKRYGIE